MYDDVGPSAAASPVEVRGLSLRQPWASLMALGEKRIETRSWKTPYRGLVAICASAKWYAEDFANAQREAFASAWRRHHGADGWKSAPLGVAVALGHLTDCLRVEDFDFRKHSVGEWEPEFGNYSAGRFAWVFTGVRALKQPVPVRGSLGVYRLPPSVCLEIIRACDL